MNEQLIVMSPRATNRFFRVLGEVTGGHLSVVGLWRDGTVVGSFTEATSGETFVATFSASDGIRKLASRASYATAVMPDGRVCGHLGFGDEAFLFSPVEGFQHLSTPTRADRASAQACGHPGLIGGTAEASQADRAVVWESGRPELLAGELTSILAINSDGIVAGQLADGSAFRTTHAEILRAEPQIESLNGAYRRPVAIQSQWGVLLASRYASGTQEIGWWKPEGAYEPLPQLGERAQPIGADRSGNILAFGTDAEGQLRHYLILADGTVVILSGEVIEPQGITVSAITAIAEDGTLAGLGTKDGREYVVTLTTLSTHAVTEQST